ncbi:hypothetical protein WEB32_20535 [Streptomyces netropsis]|uniref:Transcriptional regulator with XRE-family HTH domain n=1 Tax=Streptomyces netropsis TaxID=55404 RepID=A0A7W7LEI1_STRNE|nr:helix-turn-helix transcriptional regulator [Streptomyces netropsis]MBB4888728.1 transcriptional regulator with XRE-family HTH domain [Streptomyces netropsis]GGR14686.1 hypothetical protein GCM10010219_19390 [Streptomyces netropsis]
MARPEKPIDPTAPYATFALQLRKLRKAAGSPTYTTLARRTSYSVPALSQAAAGWKLPSLKLTLAYATACGAGHEHWTEQWLIAQHQAGPGPLGGPAAAEMRPWSTQPPVPATAGAPREFIACLRELKLWAGNPSLSRLEDIARNWGSRAARLPRSTIGDALSPKRTSLPNSFVVRSLVLACLTFAQRQGRIRAEETGPVADEWQEHWLRLYANRHRQRAPRPAPKAATAAWLVLAEKTVEAVDLPLRQDRELRPIDRVPHDQRMLATGLRALFEMLGTSLRSFAARHHMDPSALSRYLSGSRIPPREFLQLLVREVSIHRGLEVAPEAVQHLYELHLATLRSRTTPPTAANRQPSADATHEESLLQRVQRLSQALDDAQSRLRRSIELEAALKAALYSREQALAEREARLRELQGPRQPQPV